MNNLFSIFDPQTHSFLYLNWVSTITLVLVMPGIFWISNSVAKNFLYKIIYLVNLEIKAVLGVSSALGSSALLISLFLFIILNNSIGLAPYIFTSTAHLTLAFSLALPLWIGHVLYAWVITPNNILAHLVPLGTPNALMPFIVLIELVRNVIRPLTLSVRLAANIVAGHLLLTLLSSSCLIIDYSLLLFLIRAIILLRVLESAVAAIQAYVFRILSTLYVRDVNAVSFVN